MANIDASESAWRDFVLGSNEPGGPVRTATLGIVRAGGAPHVSPVWIDLDGDEVAFTTGRSTIKGKAVLRDHRVALCWQDERPPFSYVTVAGTARVIDDPTQVRYWAGRIGARYMGADRAEEFAARNGVPGEVLVRVRPEKIVVKTAVSD